MHAIRSAGSLPSARRASLHGFTLIELSIVLVIIGLITGAILTGRDLIEAAEVRAAISQIEKYNSAVNTFKGKYGALPGDMVNSIASAFGFVAGRNGPGQGDGNEILQGNDGSGNVNTYYQGAGETVLFWSDLSVAGLIEGSYTAALPATLPSANVTGADIGKYFPPSKLGQGNYVYVWNPIGQGGFSGNYFAIAAVPLIQVAQGGALYPTAGMTVQEAYNIDQKIDDGNPQTGHAISGGICALFNPLPFWAINNVCTYVVFGAAPGTAATPDATTCYDNGGSAASPMHYSVEENGGSGMNCTLSIKFQ